MSGRLVVLLVMALLALPFVLAYCAAPPVAAAPPHAVYLPVADSGTPAPAPPIRVVWIESRYEVITPAEAAAYRSEIARGLAYWRDLVGVPLPPTWQEATITIADPFSDWRWLQALNDPDMLTIAVVENSSQRKVDLGGGVSSYGYNIPGGAAFYCATHGDLLPGQGQQLGLCVAHELGHWLGLPEGGIERDGRPASIMRDLVAAWERGELHPLDREQAVLPHRRIQ